MLIQDIRLSTGADEHDHGFSRGGCDLLPEIFDPNLEEQQCFVGFCLLADAVTKIGDGEVVISRDLDGETCIGVGILVVVDCGGDVEDQFPGLAEVLRGDLGEKAEAVEPVDLQSFRIEGQRRGERQCGCWEVGLPGFDPGITIVILPEHHAVAFYEVAEPHPVIFESVAVEHHDVLQVVAFVHVDHVPGGIHHCIQLVADGSRFVGLLPAQDALDDLDGLAELGSAKFAVRLVLERKCQLDDAEEARECQGIVLHLLLY